MAAADEILPKTKLPHSLRYAWFVVIVLTMCLIVSWIDRLVIALVIDPIRASLHISDLQAAVLQGPAFTICYGIAGPVFGYLADRSDRKRLLLGCLTLWAFAAAGCGLATNYTSLVVLRALVGIGEAGMTPIASALICEMFPADRRARPLATYQLGTVFGGTVAFWSGGHILRMLSHQQLTLEPWRILFMIFGLGGGLVALLLVLSLSLSKPQGAMNGNSLADSIRALTSRWKMLTSLLSAYVLINMFQGALVGWFPTLLMREHGVTSDEAGNSIGPIYMLSGVIGLMLGGYGADLIGRYYGPEARLKVITAGLLVIVVPFALLFTVYTFQTALISYFVLNLCAYAFSVPMIVTYLSTVPDRTRGFSQSVWTTINIIIGIGIGPVIVPVVSGLVKSPHNSISLTLCIVTVGCALLAIIALWLNIMIGRSNENMNVDDKVLRN